MSARRRQSALALLLLAVVAATTAAAAALAHSQALAAPLFARHELYEYDRDAGIRRRPMNALAWSLRLERQRAYHVLKALWQEYAAGGDDPPRRDRVAAEADAARVARTSMGDDWAAAQAG